MYKPEQITESSNWPKTEYYNMSSVSDGEIFPVVTSSRLITGPMQPHIQRVQGYFV
jgi:hypothetical protein